ncbi:HAD-IA family hydrolase [Chamaesiphon minutus]|uniref:Haloacid dehalogenase superfamily protein, subfamily IA, variant 3 with third motif having DD or ED n=1 Tax=Chamaesiphon minutus (strain ATCC 27169 / PCC 6605) TaxID=1173020 RepID=K9UEG0_CHAP6|nr:HAD-IA family hydrolase [Chamaesiphon minutus]AFY93507.1 haloacid dehalogenase superfamily protein, subfamily IA, variant 3 with third motif having DD or ED [Chamaesiphon minutus PCC 6605]
MPQLKAVIFGTPLHHTDPDYPNSPISETSDIQRQAFNEAFAAAGLDWHWTAQTYNDLLKIKSDPQRMRAYRDADLARINVTDSTIAALHKAKTGLYMAMLADLHLRPRPGVAETIELCANNGIHLALCTATTLENIDGLRTALADLLPFDRFATIVTIESIERAKPAPDAYIYCLKQLQIAANEAIAIEDTPVGIAAAKAAGIITIGTPDASNTDRDFAAANLIIHDLNDISLDLLMSLLDRQPAPLGFS